MHRLLLPALLFAATLPAQDLGQVLRRVEQRYNRARTLEAGFEQRQWAQGRRTVEAGRLVLRKPGRMRWTYSQPEGKLFVSDGQWVYFYSPLSGTAEKARLKETEDFRAPLAFLLGRLDFQRDFGRFEWTRDGQGRQVRAFPKSDKAPYTQVDFDVTEEGRILRLLVAGVDGSRTEFVFTGERINPPVDEAQFRFQAPPGVAVMEVNEP
jgi:outer membrane lipoprotein carrier protein